MKKLIYVSLLFFASIEVFGQQLFFEAYSAYNLTAYDNELYPDSKGYFPLGFKIAGGHQYVQAGIDYRQHLTDPEFEITSNPLLYRRHTFKETYYGAFIRGNVSSLPAYRFGLIMSAGMGYYKPTLNVFDTKDATDPIETLEYDKKLGYNFYIGVSAPIYAQLHWEIGYQYNLIDRQGLPEKNLPGYAANYHMIHVGLSGNFVFGNTEKRCRQVISSRRRR